MKKGVFVNQWFLGATVVFVLIFSCKSGISQDPRVFIFTDINIDAGDPDDRQSLIHLMWYANEMRIEGIVPDRWDAQGYEACQKVLQAYQKDYAQFNFERKGYPKMEDIQDKVAKDTLDAIQLFSKAASKLESPLYVLVWGNMEVFSRAISEQPGLAQNIRLITIGTGLMMERDIVHMPSGWKKSAPCKQLNWNGFGRNGIYNDPNFNSMWWLEMNWTYAGMFPGEEPKEMFRALSQYGSLGSHMKEVVKRHDWAQYFRVGDTPSVLYVLDPDNALEDPTQGSWAGKFVSPFPKERPNYFTDAHGAIPWDYQNPCTTWENHVRVAEYAQNTLKNNREAMYRALLDKLDNLYAVD